MSSNVASITVPWQALHCLNGLLRVFSSYLHLSHCLLLQSEKQGYCFFMCLSPSNVAIKIVRKYSPSGALLGKPLESVSLASNPGPAAYQLYNLEKEHHLSFLFLIRKFEIIIPTSWASCEALRSQYV